MPAMPPFSVWNLTNYSEWQDPSFESNKYDSHALYQTLPTVTNIKSELCFEALFLCFNQFGGSWHRLNFDKLSWHSSFKQENKKTTYSLYFTTVTMVFASFLSFHPPCKGIDWIVESGKFLLVESRIWEMWVLDCRILGFGVQNTAQGIWNPTNVWNLESKFHWQRIQKPVPGIQNPRWSWIFLQGVISLHEVQDTGKDFIPVLCVHHPV